MTDYRDFNRPGYVENDPIRTGRSGGGTGVLIALGVLALLAILLFAFAGSGTNSTSSGDNTTSGAMAPQTDTTKAPVTQPATPVAPAQPVQ